MAENFDDEDELVSEDREDTPEPIDVKPTSQRWRDIEKKREERALKKLLKNSFDDYPED